MKRTDVDSTVYMNCGRWRDWGEVAGFFPQEMWELDWEVEFETNRLARQDETITIHGTCSLAPEEREIIHDWSKPTLEQQDACKVRHLIKAYGMTEEQARFFLRKKKEFIKQELELENAAVEARDRKKAQRTSAYDWDKIKKGLVPLTDEPVHTPDPELLRARAKQARMEKRVAREQEAVNHIQKVFEQMKAAQAVFKNREFVG